MKTKTADTFGPADLVLLCKLEAINDQDVTDWLQQWSKAERRTIRKTLFAAGFVRYAATRINDTHNRDRKTQK